jgi:DNA-binding CsgD family transcriptional regulator
VHLIRYQNGRPVGSVAAGQGGVAGAPLEDYARYWVRHDPWAQAGAALPLGVHDIARTVPPESLRRSRMWNDWGRPNDAAFHCIAMQLKRDGDRVAGVFFHRRESETPFGAPQRTLLEGLYPHVRRVLDAESRLAPGTQAPPDALRAGLDTLTDGIALYDARRNLAFANGALMRMAAEEDGLALGPAGLTAPEPASRVALSRALTAALAAVEGKVWLLSTAGTIALPRPSGRAPWLVRALPMLRGGTTGLPGGFRGAMLIVTDGEARRQPTAALLGRLFALTPAEAALAAALAAGQTLADHARRRGIAVETARSHMAAIRRKTGCRRQAELATLLARLPG